MAGRLGPFSASLLIAVGAVSVDAAQGAGGDPLAAHRWTSRVLVIAAPKAGDARLRAQREALAAVRPGSAERDLVVIEAVGKEPRAEDLRRRFGLDAGIFRVVLVGKDGGEKLSSDEPIPPQKLFATIDAMPMRRQEMSSRDADAMKRR